MLFGKLVSAKWNNVNSDSVHYNQEYIIERESIQQHYKAGDIYIRILREYRHILYSSKQLS